MRRLTEFNRLYNEYLQEFNAYLESYAEKLNTKPGVLAESMKYSLLNGGKRIRPVLMLACADVLQLPKAEVLPCPAP